MPKNENLSIICYNLPGFPAQHRIPPVFNLVLYSKAQTFKDIEKAFIPFGYYLL